MREINLTKGKTVVVDADMYDDLSQHSWHFAAHNYAARRINGVITYMHRDLVGAGKGEVVDHKNHNTLDNRLSNLRKCTPSQNSANQRVQKGSVSGYKGVSWTPRDEKWGAKIGYEGKRINLGYFADIDDAARMYNFWAADIFGEFAYLNKIKSVGSPE